MKRIFNSAEIDFVTIEARHKSFYYLPVLGLLNQYRGNRHTPAKIKNILDLIIPLLSDILIGKPNKLLQISEDYLKLYRKLKAEHRSILKKKLCQIFDYDAFVESELPNWGAYKLAESIDIPVCVYCNRLFTNTIDRVDRARQKKRSRIKGAPKVLVGDAFGKTRPEFDHFLPKSLFPLFSLSLYNMVPSCHVCNSNLKGSRTYFVYTNGKGKMDYTRFHNPFNTDFHENIVIELKFNSKSRVKQYLKGETKVGGLVDHFGFALFLGDPKAFEVKFNQRPGSNMISYEKCMNSTKLFALEELYSFHKDHAYRLMQNALMYNSISIADIRAKAPSLFGSDREVLNARFMSETDPNRINYFPLSKFTIDILNEFGINF